MNRIKDITGRKFGRLIVIRMFHKDVNNKTHIL